jgi:SAM-dependent methyltransferase
MDKNKLIEETQITIQNRKRLMSNHNLLFWYKQLYIEQFNCFPDIWEKQILEIGSGTSPLKIFYNHVLTSDIMDLDYLDYVFNAQEIDSFSDIPDNSIDIISITNVLHHLKNPCDFLLRAAKKLKKGGLIIFTEPYMSWLSKFIYLYLHYETTDLSIEKPELPQIEGPLSSANNALPFLIFNGPWADCLRGVYSFSDHDRRYFSVLSYMATGGIRRNFGIPRFIYKIFFHIDRALSRLFPKFCASFFIQILKKQ